MALHRFFGKTKSGPAPALADEPQVVAVKEEPQGSLEADLEAMMEAAAPAPRKAALATPRKPRKAAGAGAASPAVKREPPMTAKKAEQAKVIRALLGVKVVEKVKKMRKLKVRKGHTASWGRLRFAGMKRPQSPYAHWSMENRIKIQGELKSAGKPVDFGSVSKAVGAAWGLVTDEEKAPYSHRFEELKKVWEAARDAYMQYQKDHTKNRQVSDAQRALFRGQLQAAKTAMKAATKVKKSAAGAVKKGKVALKKRAKAGEVVTPESKGSACLEDTPVAPTQRYRVDPAATQDYKKASPRSGPPAKRSRAAASSGA